MKVIFHLDLDSYFVSAERTIDRSLKNRPVVISSGERRSIISAASYEAKRRGIYVPMPFYKAKIVCPDVIAVKPNFALYTTLSAKVFELISNNYTNNIEVASIDECYIDVTSIWESYGSPVKLAKEIQNTILKKIDLSASIGISNNKFVAKMSTSINKPFGITVTKPGAFPKQFWKQPIIDFYGIGRPSATKLEAIGIKTIGDLAVSSEEKIKSIFGSRSGELIKNANGFGDDQINTEHNELKGIGNSRTFMKSDLADRKDILSELSSLTKLATHRAIIRNMVGKVISVTIKEKGGKEIKATRKQKTLKRPINSYQEVFEVAVSIFDELWKENALKFIGVHIGQLQDMFESTKQMSIYDKEHPISKVEEIINKINSNFNKKVVITGKEAFSNTKRNQNQSRYIESDRILKHFDDEYNKNN